MFFQILFMLTQMYNSGNFVHELLVVYFIVIFLLISESLFNYYVLILSSVVENKEPL